jgi:hypothetical protein
MNTQLEKVVPTCLPEKYGYLMAELDSGPDRTLSCLYQYLAQIKGFLQPTDHNEHRIGT